MNVEFGPAHGEHFTRSIQFHGATSQGVHRPGQGDVLGFKTLDVSHHLAFGMHRVEYFLFHEILRP